MAHRGFLVSDKASDYISFVVDQVISFMPSTKSLLCPRVYGLTLGNMQLQAEFDMADTKINL